MGKKSNRQQMQDRVPFTVAMSDGLIKAVRIEVTRFMGGERNVQKRETMIYEELMNAALAHEETMRAHGLKVPKLQFMPFRERIAGKGGAVDAPYVCCKRCIFQSEAPDKDGYRYCTVMKMIGPHGEYMRLYTSDYEGCSWGQPKS